MIRPYFQKGTISSSTITDLTIPSNVRRSHIMCWNSTSFNIYLQTTAGDGSTPLTTTNYDKSHSSKLYILDGMQNIRIDNFHASLSLTYIIFGEEHI